METYYLVYAFDRECERSVTLKEGTLEEIDNFTSKFNNSNEIREAFKKDIEFYRRDKQEFIERIEKKTGKKETGDIVVHSIECGRSREKINKRTRVMYKYHKDVLNEILSNQKFMEIFSKKCYRERHIPFSDQKIYPLSEFETSRISFPKSTTKTEYNSVLNKWKSKIKKSDRYFATMREIFSLYRQLENEMDFIPFEKLVTKYKNMYTISKSKLSKESKTAKVKLEKTKCDTNFTFIEDDSYTESLEDLLHTDDWHGSNNFENEEQEDDFMKYAEEKINRK